MDKVYRIANLQSAFNQVWRNGGSAGIDGQRVKQFEAQEEQQLQQLSQELKSGTYRPAAVKRVWIPKAGKYREATTGDPCGQGSGSANGAAQCNGANLRVRFCRAELRLSDPEGELKQH